MILKTNVIMKRGMATLRGKNTSLWYIYIYTHGLERKAWKVRQNIVDENGRYNI